MSYVASSADHARTLVRPFRFTARAGAALLAVTAILAAPAQTRSAAQAPDLVDGEGHYQRACASCHGTDLQGHFGPALIGSEFSTRWGGRYAELQSYIREAMPPASPTLDAASAGRLIIFLRAVADGDAQAVVRLAQQSDAAPREPPAAPPLAAPPAAVGPQGAPLPDRDAAPPKPRVVTLDATAESVIAKRKERMAAFHPVTADDLSGPNPDSWATFRRTYAAQGFSPLTDINKDTVSGLALSWAAELPRGTNEIEPLEHDGVLFVNSSREVAAFDAATGDRIWQYSHEAKPGVVPVSQPKNMAMWDRTLFVGTGDAHMLAIDATTGSLLWDHTISPPEANLQLTGGPIVVKGKILQGVAGCSEGRGRCFVVALDAATGRELWRFNTVAMNGEPGGNTWNGAPDGERSGGSVWMAPSYDASTNLAYFGTGQTYHITPLLAPMRRSTARNSALYTNTTIAIDPDTGKMAWHYQHFGRDVWDLDWAFERTLFDAQIDGRETRVVATMGKIGIVDLLDARSGRYLKSYDLGMQNLIERINPKSGEKTVFANQIPVPDRESIVCPSPFGVRNFLSTAFDPHEGMLFVPMLNACMKFTFRSNSRYDQSMREIAPLQDESSFGGLAAIALPDAKQTWRNMQRQAIASAALATAGGVLFEGSRDRGFRAYESKTGKLLWETRLNASPNSYPITYRVAGRQYVAVVAGGGGPTDAAFRQFTPETEDAAPATTLLVFALPERPRAQGGARP